MPPRTIYTVYDRASPPRPVDRQYIDSGLAQGWLELNRVYLLGDDTIIEYLLMGKPP